MNLIRAFHRRSEVPDRFQLVRDDQFLVLDA